MIVLDDYLLKLSTNYNIIIEERIKLCVKPKPDWMSQALYNWFLGNLVYMEHHKV